MKDLFLLPYSGSIAAKQTVASECNSNAELAGGAAGTFEFGSGQGHT